MQPQSPSHHQMQTFTNQMQLFADTKNIHADNQCVKWLEPE